MPGALGSDKGVRAASASHDAGRWWASLAAASHERSWSQVETPRSSGQRRSAIAETNAVRFHVVCAPPLQRARGQYPASAPAGCSAAKAAGAARCRCVQTMSREGAGQRADRQAVQERCFQSCEVDNGRHQLQRQGCGRSRSVRARHSASTASLIASEIPVMRVTAGGICAPLGSSMRRARANRQRSSRTCHRFQEKCPRGAAAVAWQSEDQGLLRREWLRNGGWRHAPRPVIMAPMA